MDKLVQKLVALGVPGLVLLAAVATSGVAGGAAIVAGLMALGGPFGVIGGIGVLGVLTLISDVLAEYGFERIAEMVVRGLVEKGMTQPEIRAEIEGYPISAGMKGKLLELV